MNNRWTLWVVVLAWCGVIYYFTESPLFTGANTARWIQEIVGQLPLVHAVPIDGEGFSWNAIIRKFAHVTVFGLLAVAVWRALYPRRWAMVGAWLFAVGYACLDEWHQSFQPGRTPLVSDMVIDALGAALALWLVHRSMRNVRQSHEQEVR
jgi:VanZ family protein